MDFDDAGLQILINPRSGKIPFDMVSMADVMTGAVDAELIRDRIVIIGITSISVKDLVNSAAINSRNPGLVYGVEMHAHITSQILSTVLDNRPMLRVWGNGWEYLWIIAWGITGIVLGRKFHRPASYVLVIGLTGLGLTGASFALLWLGGWWIPVIPALVALTMNGLILPSIFLYDKTLRDRIQDRQQIIERTYDDIHSGPLQTLAILLQQRETLEPAVGQKLEDLDNEIRTIYVRLLRESLSEEYQFPMVTGAMIDLRSPIKEILYQVYNETLKRDFQGFDSIRIYTPDFQPLSIEGLSFNDKRSLCRFLEEALCNVGKHTNNPKRIEVLCCVDNYYNVIRIKDNGQKSNSRRHRDRAARTRDTAGQGFS